MPQPNDDPHPPAEIDIGDPGSWSQVYVLQAELDQKLLVALASSSPELQGIAAMLCVAAELVDTEAIEKLTGQTEEQGDASPTHTERLIQAMEECRQSVVSIYGQVNSREQELGARLKDIPPSDYVTRAIGQPHLVIEERYNQVRAEVEIFRKLTGQTDEAVTLGHAADVSESWLRNKLENTALNILSIQLLQILLSDDPMSTAQELGKETLIEELGIPPQLSAKRIAEVVEDFDLVPWMSRAVAFYRKKEPPALGLVIDQ